MLRIALEARSFYCVANDSFIAKSQGVARLPWLGFEHYDSLTGKDWVNQRRLFYVISGLRKRRIEPNVNSDAQHGYIRYKVIAKSLDGRQEGRLLCSHA